ncbi:hypothetical protein TNCV_3705881 [Trichonephila clavipes]|nr:hypothetical protein TNCV_3705881 [Trichonephila clavipes]
MGRGGLMVVKETKQQKFFLQLGVVAMSLETLPEFNAIYDGTFPILLHEEVHEDVSHCTMAGRRAVLLAKWIVRSVPLEIVGSSGHEKVHTRGKPGLERPGRPRRERIEGSCGKHMWTPQRPVERYEQTYA